MFKRSVGMSEVHILKSVGERMPPWVKSNDSIDIYLSVCTFSPQFGTVVSAVRCEAGVLQLYWFNS